MMRRRISPGDLPPRDPAAMPDRPTCRTHGLLGLALLLAGSVPVAVHGQQPRWQVDLNGSRIQYDTLAALNAPSLAASLEWQRSTLLARLGGSFTGFEDNGQSVQGRGDLVGWFSPAGAASPLRLEVSGGVGGSRHSSGFQSHIAQADLRLHLQGRRGGGWIGSGAATARNSFDEAAVTSFTPNLGGWVQLGPTRLIGRYVDTRVEGERFPEVSASAVYSRGPVDLTAFAGYRDSPFEEVDSDGWAGASAAFWLQSNIAVLVSGGRYAPDVIQGLPGGEFISLGVRFSPRRQRPVAPTEPLPLLFTRESARSGGLVFRVPDAGTVEVAGDWNGWQPQPLSRAADGGWRLPAELEPGVYRFNLRVDGAEWVVPEGFPTVDDGFGGQVGILVISES